MPDARSAALTRPIPTEKPEAQEDEKKPYVDKETGIEISDWDGMEGEAEEKDAQESGEKPEKRAAKPEAEPEAEEETAEQDTEQAESEGPPPWLRQLFQDAQQQQEYAARQTQTPVPGSGQGVQTPTAPADAASLMDTFINDPKSFETRVAQIGKDAATREFQGLREQLQRERISRASRSYQEHIGKAFQQFSDVEKSPEYKNPKYAQAVNGFLYQLANYAQAQIMYAANAGQDADVSYLSDPVFLEFAKVMAAKSAGIQPNVTKVGYASEKNKATTKAPQRKKTTRRTEDEERMRIRLGLSEEQWDKNEQEGEELGL